MGIAHHAGKLGLEQAVEYLDDRFLVELGHGFLAVKKSGPGLYPRPDTTDVVRNYVACCPPGLVTPLAALVAARVSFCATSPNETMPTRRFSRFTTGRRRTCCSLMFFATWSSSSSS